MVRGMIESFVSRRPENIDLTGIDISHEAKRILGQSLDKTTLNLLCDRFRPLPDLYRKPQEAIKEIAERPILIVETGSSPTASSMNRYYRSRHKPPIETVPRKDYFITSNLSAARRTWGECSDINSWLLQDMEETGLLDGLAMQGIHVSVVQGNSPLFFNQPEANHIWIRFNTRKGAIIVDPAFGVVVGEAENHGYKTNEKVAIEKFRAAENHLIRIHGWQELLDEGGICPNHEDTLSPYGTMLGLSREDQYSYTLGFETKTDTPFISVGYPDTNIQEMYWMDKDEVGKGYRAMMTSEASHAPVDMAIADPVARAEIDSMLEALMGFRFEEPHMNDPRLVGVHFPYD